MQEGDVRWPLPLEVLVAVNLVIFLGWLLGSTRWMVKYFEVSAQNFLRRPWTLLTAPVSHADLYSLIGNFQARPLVLLLQFAWFGGKPGGPWSGVFRHPLSRLHLYT